MYEEEISKFVEKHLSLIEEERLEECNQSQNLLKTYNSGVSLKNLTISSYSSCLGGYVLAEFRSSKSKILQVHNLSHGDVVGVVEGTDLQQTPIATGVVKFSKDEVIGVSFEDVDFNENDDILYSLIKLANDVTYSRLKSSLKALNSVNKLPGRILAELLFDKCIDLEKMSVPPFLMNELGDLKYINPNLHKDQREAVRFALEMKNLAVIHGPPGTGKTTTLVEIILQMVKMGNKMLVCAPSNVAVDNLVEKLAQHHVKMVRLGHPARIMENISKYSLDAIVDCSSSSQIVRDVRKELNSTLKKLKSKRRQESYSEIRNELKKLRKELQQRESRALQEVLRGADIILSTLVTASENGPLKQLPEEHFDCVVIDECSQALEAACWIALPRAAKAILAGDHLQLPPTILSKKAEENGLGLSLMERAVRKFGKEIYRLLKRQFRMHADIMMWPSNEMYEGHLEADPSVASHTLKDLPSVKTTDETELTLLLVDTAESQFEEEVFETSRCNRGEAGVISVLVKRLLDANVPQSSIAVITPYNYQVEMIRAFLGDLKAVEVKSVDGFQGREKEAVLLSLVRSNETRELGFIADRRRLNVAVSRARRFLCVVGDTRTISHDNTVHSLIDHISQHGVVHTADQYVPQIEIPKEVTQNQKFQSAGKIQNEVKTDNPSEKTKKKKKIQEQAKQSVQKNDSPITKKEKSKNQETEDHWYSVLQGFLNSNQTEIKFSVSAYERRLIHEAAEKLNLQHVSAGEGSDRYLLISKSSGNHSEDTAVKSKQVNKKKIVQKSDCDLKITPREECYTEKDKQTVNIKQELQNAEIQQPRLENLDLKNVKTPNEMTQKTPQQAVERTESKKPEKVNKKSKKKQEPEDFDSLLAEFQEMDKRCAWSNCKIPTDLVGLTCVHCKLRFCLTHGLPEIHGCGDAARKQAKHDYKNPRPKKPDPLKRNAASRKLEKKLHQMAEDRKSHKKET